MMVKTEEIQKILGKFPHGVKVQDLADKCRVGKTTVYETLNKLRECGQAYNEKGLWFPQQEKETSPSSSLVISDDATRKEIQLVKEEYVNRQTDKAFRRVSLLCYANNGLPKEWVIEMKGTFDLLSSELEVIKTDPLERFNLARQQRILGYEAAIVVKALSQWIPKKEANIITN